MPANVPAASRLIGPEREHHRSRSQHGYHTHFRSGRMWVAVIFCLLRVVDLLVYLSVGFYDIAGANQAVMVSALWTTSLLVGMWMRQGWARYILIGLMIIGVAAGVFALADISVRAPDAMGNPAFGMAVVMVMIDAAILGMLIGLDSVRRLTNRSYA
jgi:hypothetical protein